MVWRLTLFGVLISLWVGASTGQSPAAHSLPSGVSESASASTHSVRWEHVPLGDAVARLKSASGDAVFLDRRVDPNRHVNLTIDDAGVHEIVAQLAAACSLGHCQLGRLFYIGPRRTAERLPALAALRRKEVAELAVDMRRTLLMRRPIGWPRRTEPRDLTVRLLQEHGWAVERADLIPHDLWPAGALPKLTLADQLTLLLAGFDRTYRIVPERRAIEIVPVNWDQIESTAAASTARSRPMSSTPGGKQVFTLRVQDQPVGKILAELGRRLGWQLTVDETAILAAGHSLDQRVSFAVENADADQLLEALLLPAGLTFERDGDRVRVIPR